MSGVTVRLTRGKFSHDERYHEGDVFEVSEETFQAHPQLERVDDEDDEDDGIGDLMDADLSEHTVDEIKDAAADTDLTDEQRDALVEREKTGKNRNTAIEALQ